MLEINGLCLGYGPIRVVHELSLEVPEGSIVALLGRNGAGKTTTLSGIAGLLRAQAGTVEFQGRPITKMGIDKTSRSGLAYVPEGRGVCRG